MNPKIYHIVHVDRLASIIADGHLWSDAEARRRRVGGTTIGMNSIKERRLRMPLSSHVGLKVGDCVPFYFCPRSVMLYQIHKGNDPGLAYRGGQDHIIHLEADLRSTVTWAQQYDRRWAFTTSNAAASYSGDYSELSELDKISWDAINTRWWSGPGIDPLVKGHKQAEFLVEDTVPWRLVARVGVRTNMLYDAVQQVLVGERHRPTVEVKPDWYY